MSKIIDEISSRLYQSPGFEEFSCGSDGKGNSVIEYVVECFWDSNEKDTSLFMDKVQAHMKTSHMIGFSAFNLKVKSIGEAANTIQDKIDTTKAIPKMNGITWRDFRCFVSSDPDKIKACKAKVPGVYPVLLSSGADYNDVQQNQCLIVPYAVNQRDSGVLKKTATVFSIWLLCLVQGIRFLPDDKTGGILRGDRFNKREESWCNAIAEHIGKIVYLDNTEEKIFLEKIKNACKDHIPVFSNLLYSTNGYEKIVGSMTLERPENCFLRILSYIFNCLCSYSTRYTNRDVFTNLIGDGFCDTNSYVEEEKKFFEGYWDSLWRDGRGITKSLPLLINASKDDGFLNEEIIKTKHDLEAKIKIADEKLDMTYKPVGNRTLNSVLNDDLAGVYNAIKEIKKCAGRIAWLVFVRDKMSKHVEENYLKNRLDELNTVLQLLQRTTNATESMAYDENKLLPELNAVEKFKNDSEINEAAKRLNSRWSGNGMLLTSVSNQALEPDKPSRLIASVNFKNPKTEKDDEWVFVEGLSDLDVCFLNLSI